MVPPIVIHFRVWPLWSRRSCRRAWQGPCPGSHCSLCRLHAWRACFSEPGTLPFPPFGEAPMGQEECAPDSQAVLGPGNLKTVNSFSCGCLSTFVESHLEPTTSERPLTRHLLFLTTALPHPMFHACWALRFASPSYPWSW